MKTEILLACVAIGALAVIALTSVILLFRILQRQMRRVEAREARLPEATRLADLSDRIQETRQRLEHHEQRLAQMHNEVESLQARRAQLKVEVGQLEGMSTTQQTLRQDLDQLSAERRQLSQALSETASNRDAAQRELVELTAKIANESKGLEESAARQESMKAQRDALQVEVSDLSAMSQTRRQLETEVEQLREQQQQLDQQVAATSRRHDRMREETLVLATRLQNATAVLEEANASPERLGEGEHSESWLSVTTAVIVTMIGVAGMIMLVVLSSKVTSIVAGQPAIVCAYLIALLPSVVLLLSAIRIQQAKSAQPSQSDHPAPDEPGDDAASGEPALTS